MPAVDTDLVLIERAGVLHKAAAAEIAALAAGGAGGAPPASAINSAGVKRIANRNGYGSVGGLALSPGWVYLQAFAPQSIEQVAGAGIEITATGAGSVIIGLYDVTAGGTATRVAATGLIDVSATGFRTANFSAPFTPSRTEYMMGIATSAQCTTRAESTIQGLMPLSAGANRGQLFFARTWDGTLPATLGLDSPSGFRSQVNIAFLTV